MGDYEILDDWFAPNKWEAAEYDVDCRISRGDAAFLAKVLDEFIDDGFEGFAKRLVKVLEHKSGSPEEIKDAVYLAAGELRRWIAAEYVRRVM